MPHCLQKIKGFTLIEIMAVILILGGTAALALPNYEVSVQRVRNQEAIPILLAIFEAQRSRVQDGNGYTQGAGLSMINTELNLELPPDGTLLNHFEAAETYPPTQKTLNVSPPDIARIRDKQSRYWLYILEDGQIFCKGIGTNVGEIGELCSRMGFSSLNESASSPQSSTASGSKVGCGAQPAEPNYPVLELF